jgi:hypothetical protein
MRNTHVSPLALVLALASAAYAWSSPFDVVINEIHYNTFYSGAEAELEFVELFNRGGEAVDLSGWSFSRGLGYSVPAGTTILPHEHLVVAADPDALRVRYGLSRVLGPFSRRLDNNGEILELVNARGEVMSRVHYGDDDPWPSRPDGLGPSLEFTRTDNGNDLASRWKPSFVLGGTPGAKNSRLEEPVALPAPQTAVLVAEDDEWRTFEGRSEPSAQPLAWAGLAFNDASWTLADGGFGYGEDHGFQFNTELNDMLNQYPTFYIRRAFQLDASLHTAILAGERSLRLRVSFDDAYVAYLNGVEVSRQNIAGQVGAPVPFNANANSNLSESADVALGAFVERLRIGTNVLAVQGVNRRIFSFDFFIGASLVAIETQQTEPPEEQSPYVGGILNEIRPSGGAAQPGFIELYNPLGTTLDLGQHVLLSSHGDFYRLPANASLSSRAFLSLPDTQLGFNVRAEETTYALLAPDGATIIDAVEVAPVGAGNSAGRHPDGDEDVFVLVNPTLGAANVYNFTSPVVINEIHFHPPFVAPSGGCLANCSDAEQWVELHNRSASVVNLSGWSLTKGVDFTLPAGTIVPAGGYLVVAASLATFRTSHPGVGPVVGDWTGRLRHSSDTINLRDPLGNRVDHVHYGDGKPQNDEEPVDGVDDGTFRGTSWPLDSDGTGRTLELVNPNLDNRAGLAWRSSAVIGGTPGAPNSTQSATAPPTVDDVESEPGVPRSNQAVRITCRLSSLLALTTAEVRWAVDGGGPQGTAPLRDDGMSGDGRASDGRFGALIPAQADGAVVRFTVFVQDSGSRSSLVPLGPDNPPYGGFQGPFFLYEVDDSVAPPTGAPVYRVVMTNADLAELDARNVFSDVLLPATFFDGDKAHHLCGLRYRGETSRNEANRSYKLRFASERTFGGAGNVNLNAANGGNLGTQTVNEILSDDLYRRAGAAYPQSEPVVLHFAGEVSRDFDTRYVIKEQFNEDFLGRFFGGDDGGNFYRARNPVPGGDSGNLSYRGEDPAQYRDLYEKRSNEEEADWSDVIELCRTFDPAQTPDAVFADTVEDLVDARQWAQFFAVMACLSNSDGGIWNNNGEDYFLYRVPDASTRPYAGKWLLLPWDLEETLTDSNERLFRSTVPAVQRFFSQPRFARLYYEELRRVQEGAFSRAEMRQRYGHVDLMFPPADVFNVVDPIDAYIARRLGYYDRNVASSLETGAVNQTGGTLVIAAGDSWRFFRGTANPPGGAGAWTQLNYSDAGWEEGPSGLGYGDGDDATVLADMQGPGGYTTVFARRRFQVPNPAGVAGMTLTVDYDDAFVAYLNGVEVARSPNAPGGAIDFNDAAQNTHEASAGQGGNPPENFPIDFAVGALEAGTNVLAVVGLNTDTGSSDFSLIPTLSLSTASSGPAGGCGSTLFATGSQVSLAGYADPVGTESVTVNGAPASFQYVTTGNGPYGVRWQASVDLAPGTNTLTVRAHDAPAGSGAVIETAAVVVRRAAGFANVTGTLAANTTWTAAGSPYRLRGNLTVPQGVSLTIGAGTVVLADAGASILVNGVLQAQGTEAQPVLFRTFDCAAPWGGIAFLNTGISAASPLHILRFCDLEGGTTASGEAGCIAPVDARLRMEDTRLAGIEANAVDGTDAVIEVVRCRFEGVFEGVHCNTSVTSIEDSTFDGMIGDTDAIDFDGGGAARSRIERCLLMNGTDDGIDIGGCTVDIRDNVFRGISDKAISLEVNGPQGPPAVTGNVISACGTGMAIKDGITINEGDHNTVSGCQEGIDLFAKDDGPAGGHGTFHSVIVWDNIVNVAVDARSTVSFTFSNVGYSVDPTAPMPGQGNLAADPLFENPAAGVFALRPGSPCIGTGQGGTDMGALPFAGGPGSPFVRADSDLSGAVALNDAVHVLRFLFQGAVGPACRDVLDANDDSAVDVSDAVYVLRFLFAGGPAIPSPWPAAGLDPTADGLVCP